uniref:class I SAM-dependent methyltransferase n=1 Tax=Endozoicomonas sp. ALE010 TaxID=3403081 RepID=UPI003BB69CCB
RLYRQSDVGSPTGDFHPISSCPCRAYQKIPGDAYGAPEFGVMRTIGESSVSQKWNSKKYSKDASFVSELGFPVVDLLAPKNGEIILDLGCGDGTLAKKLESFGCEVIGVDFSESMVSSAKEKGIEAYCLSGEKLKFREHFDAVFSNAALHWMTDYDSVLNGVFSALKSNGRFIGEFGGIGNIKTITDAIDYVFKSNPKLGCYQSPWFFPSDKQYQKILERNGFIVDSIELIERPTPLVSGIREWLDIFAEHTTSSMSTSSKNEFLNQIEALVKPKLYTKENGWVADYVRLRFSAHKSA